VSSLLTTAPPHHRTTAPPHHRTTSALAIATIAADICSSILPYPGNKKINPQDTLLNIIQGDTSTNMAASNIQVQWSLSTSSESVLSVARGVMAAATTNNIQALAILACERFGNTLAMSRETCYKIETTVLPSPQPAPVTFLKGVIGFFKDDCATQLGNSVAGIRFLGLATALITTLDPFEAAKALELMLQNSASDPSLLPTARQLKDLLVSLETRSSWGGFADNVVKWHTTLYEELFERRVLRHNREVTDRVRDRHPEDIAPQTAPSPEMVCRLVDTFRQVARIGESTITMVTIKVPTSAPWVIAFTEWSLGISPSIYMDNEPLLEEPRSIVKVIIPKTIQDQRNVLEVTIHHGLAHLTELVGPASEKLWSGMVSIESYGKWLLHELDFFDDEKLRLLHEALGYTIPQALSMIKCSDFNSLGRSTNPGREFGPIGKFLTDCHISPLPSISTITNTYARVFSLDGAPKFVSPKGHMLIADLPLVKLHLTSIKEICLCAQCHGYTGSNPLSCQKEIFFKWLAHITMDILAFSLFDSPISTLVRLSTHRDMPNSVEGSIFHLISTGTVKKCDDVDLLSWARNMVGHVSNKEDMDIIMTSGRGQVVYPSLFETLLVEKQGYLKLSSLPGTLRVKDSTYRIVTSPLDDIEPDDDISTNFTSYPEVSVPLNLFKNLELLWNLSIQDNDELHVMMKIRFKERNLSRIQLSPMQMIDNLKNKVILEKCSHNCRAGVEDRFCSYSAPWDTHESSINSTSQVDIVAVDRADDLRALSLACSKAPSVLRRDACLACCLNLCRNTNIHVLIL
jgi:hypothetical protein